MTVLISSVADGPTVQPFEVEQAADFVDDQLAAVGRSRRSPRSQMPSKVPPDRSDGGPTGERERSVQRDGARNGTSETPATTRSPAPSANALDHPIASTSSLATAPPRIPPQSFAVFRIA